MVTVRCDNQHFVPAGMSSCRRCGGGVATASAPAAPVLRVVSSPAPAVAAANRAVGAPRPELLTMEEYASHRNLLVVADAGVLVACLGILLGGLGALLVSLLAGIVVAGATALALSIAGSRLGTTPGRALLPASAAQAQLLDRLLVAPAVAVVVAVLSLLLRAS